jgi:hypothetical protein
VGSPLHQESGRAPGNAPQRAYALQERSVNVTLRVELLHNVEHPLLEVLRDVGHADLRRVERHLREPLNGLLPDLPAGLEDRRGGHSGRLKCLSVVHHR